MGSIYLTWLADELRAAGLQVREYSGWQNRARGSGGYNQNPLCVMEHHTASPASWDGQKDADYIAKGSDVAPVSNLYIQRSGLIWVIAGGATNTNGSGNSMRFSRGTVPQDSMNTYAVGIECGNDGVGEPWPQAQVDALIAAANAINKRLGNISSDISGHVHYTSRKIDPARADAVQGPWRPRSINSSGSWNLDDMRAVHAQRWGGGPPPSPEPPEEVMGVASIWLGGGRLDNFVTSKSGGVFHNWYIPGIGWSGWENLEGQFIGAPSVTGESDGNGTPLRLDVTGEGTDNGLWHKWYPGSTDADGHGQWSGWERIGDLPG